jgi:WD40 repeat protein
MTAQIVITFNGDTKTFYTGTSQGDIYEWQGTSCIKNAKVHSGSVRGLQWSNGYLLSSGSKDNCVKVSKGYEVIKTIDIQGFAVSLDFFNGKFLIATS